MHIDFKILKRKLERNLDIAHCFKQVAWSAQILEKYKHLDPKHPEDFSIIATKEFSEPLDALFRHVTFGKMDSKRFYLLEFVYVHYDFIAHHVERFIEQTEGMQNSEKRTRELIDDYVVYIRDGKMPDSDTQLWFDWIESMSSLYYGIIDNYIETLNKLKAKVAT